MDCYFGEFDFQLMGGIVYVEIEEDGFIIVLIVYLVGLCEVLVQVVWGFIVMNSNLLFLVYQLCGSELYGVYIDFLIGEVFLVDIDCIFVGEIFLQFLVICDEEGNVVINFIL